MKSTLALAVLMLPAAVVAQPSPALHQGPSWDLAKGAPRVDANRRFLVHADGTPFLWLGDGFARHHGPLPPVVERVLREFLRCGLLEHGFARLWCAECRRSVLVAFSCRGRSFCPSCEKKKQLLWAEWLCEEVLAAVPTATSS